MQEEIVRQICENIEIKTKILKDTSFLSNIQKTVDMIVRAYNSNNKVILCGNGGSASDAEHIEGELVGRFKMERKALPAIAITANSSTVTAIGNDYGYDKIFERQLEAHGNKGDVLLAFSTSGNSHNIMYTLEKAKNMGLKTVAFLGKDGGNCKKYADISLIVPSNDTPRIQEAHIMIGHIICGLVENNLFNKI